MAQGENSFKLVESILAEPYIKDWDHRIVLEDVDLDRCTTLERTIDTIYSVYAQKSSKVIWGDKTPSYTPHIHVLNRMFPTSKFVHIIRDGRDVTMSLVKRWWGPNDFVSAIKFWEQTVVCATRMLHMLPEDRFLELKFEDLLHAPEAELSRICDHLGVDYSEDMINDFSKHAEKKVNDRTRNYHRHLTGGISEKQARKWHRHLSKADQAIAHEVAVSPVSAYETDCGY